DLSNIAGSAVWAEAFTQAIADIPAKRLLIVLDCCHAERMTAASRDIVCLKASPGFEMTAAPEGLGAALKQGEGRAVYSSSLGNQASWERNDQTRGIFTHHFVEALQGAGNRPGDREVRLSNLMNHLGTAVPKTAKQQWGADQRPCFDIVGEDFPVALIGGGKANRRIPITIDPAQLFDEDYTRLRESFISPWPVFERVKIDRFAGRDWLEQRLDGFLKKHDRGVFVVEAEAGLGKSAFLAHLVQDRRYIHHFIELGRGQEGIAGGFR